MALSFLALTCLVGAAFAGPFQRDVERRCSAECPSISNEKFNYQPGKQYEYKFHGINYIKVTNDRKLTTEHSGIAEIHVQDQCEMFLQLRNVQISRDTDEEEDTSLIDQLESTPLHFSWVDGKIEHVCASSDESKDSENIKKGILSAIINTMSDWKSDTRHKEIDGFGSCDTQYRIVKKQRDTVTVVKEKSLKSCDNRQSGFTAMITESYSSPESEVKSVPLLSDEKLVCEQQIREGIIQHVSCKEHGFVKPLSNYESMLEFQAELELTLQDVKESRRMSQQSPSERKNILYNADQDQDVETREKEAYQLLAEICPLTEGILHPKVSKIYYKLIMVLKGLPAESIQSIYNALKRRELCHSQKTLDIFLDALPMAGTEGAIQLMVQLLKNKQVDALKSTLWPASFALIPNPNAEAISAVLPLLSGESKTRPVMLGLSAMIHRVCSQSDCDHIAPVREATRILRQSLGEHCSSDDDEKIVSVLKAFGNMGHLGDAEQAVLECASSKDKHISVRLSAIDAFRRYKNKEIPSELTELFTSSDEDFEVRIAALSTIIKNADSRVIKAIQNVVDNDQDEQVVAFTMSLVNNWKTTSSPLKHSISELLQEVQLKREDIKYWENSKNIELSTFNVPMNLGASLESNIIHSTHSKLPRSLSSKVDIDLFGTNVNLFEFGARAEGLEKVIKKLTGMETSSTSMKKSWFPLTSRQNSDSGKPEASFYLRTMGTEFLDVSVSDFTNVGNMIQVADVLNKLARGTQADFAHSFLFLNTRLVLQSVTGRSYTFGMTGSATAALTANGKFDVINLLSSPSNCDIEGRLQPSANIEFAATVGIHSEKSRPDIKIVTSIHTGGDLGAKLRLKDSHLAEARLDMPSEEVQVLKISTELFEVDSQNNEKRIVDQMEKKIDGCIRTLEKPLGIEICGQLETPKSFVSRRFPYTRGLGNLELSIRKTDRSMKGYTASIEIPKRTSNSMTYRMTVDTPGSSIKRTFQVNLDLKSSQSGENNFKLDLQSPFKEIATTGSYTFRKDLLQCSINVVSDKSQRYAMKAVVEMDLSGSKKVLKPTLQWTVPRGEPISVAGSVTYEEGRKQRITVDFKSNKPDDKPFVFSGSLVKEGDLSLSKAAQWKMSADVIAKTPLLTTKAHSILAKRSGQSQSLSSSFSLDYNSPRSSKQSIQFSSEIHQSSAKYGATAQFESTQYPRCNWVASWDMQGRLKAAMKNDILLKYGQQQEKSYIQIAQTYHHGDRNSLSEGTIAVKAPQFNVDSQLQVAADLHGKETSNLHVEVDLRYKADKHIKSLIKVSHLSQKPVKMSIKASLEYPGRKMLYEDEITETAQNVFEGKSQLQWQEHQRASLIYKYKKINDRSIMHHQLESELNIPFMRSPLKHSGMLKLTQDDLQFESKIVADRRNDYSFEAKLSKKGSSHIQVSSPLIEGKTELNYESKRKSVNVDIQLKTRNPRHVICSAAYDWGTRKSLEAQIKWDADRKPSQQLAFSTEMEISKKRSRSSYSVESKVQVLDLIALHLSSLGEDGPDCKHQISLEASGRNFGPVGITAHQEMSKNSIHSIVTYKKQQSEKAQAEIHAKWSRKSSGSEFQASASIKSPDGSFKNKEVSFRHSFSRSGSSLSCQSIARVEVESGKYHEAKVEYSGNGKESKEMKIAVKTPYQRFAEQELVVSHHINSDGQMLNAAVDCNGKKLSVSSSLKRNRNEISMTTIVKSPYSVARDIKIYAAIENQRSQKRAESHLELNGERKYDVSANYMSRQGHREVLSSLKTSVTPEIAFTMKSDVNPSSFNHELLITKDSARLLSCKIVKQSSQEEFTGQLEIKTAKSTLLDIKAVQESKGNSPRKIVLKAKGPFTPLSLSLQFSENEEGSVSQMAQICKGSSDHECYNVKAYYKKESQSDKYDKYRKITFDVEKSSEGRPVQHLCNLHYMLSVQGHSIKSKLLFEGLEKKIGYDASLKSRRNDNEPCEFEVKLHLPSRTMQAKVSALHATKQTLFEVDLVPDVSKNSHKLTMQFKRDSSSSNKISGQMGLMHPALEKPIAVRYTLTKSNSRWPSDVSLEVDYSGDSKDKLIAEMSILSERGNQKQQGITARIQSQASNLDLVVKVAKKQISSNDLYVCEWSWQSQRGLKKGELTAKLSQASSGRSRTSEVTYTSSSSQLTLLAQSTWTESLPSQLQMKLSSKDQLLGEVNYQRKGPCHEFEVKHSAPVWRNQLCVNQMENRSLKMISFEAYHKKKCVEFSLELDPSKTHVANVAAEWDKQELKQALRSLREFRPLLSALPIEKIQQELEQKSKAMFQVLKQKVWRPLSSAISQEARKLVQELRQSKEILKSLPQMPQLPSFQQMQKQIQQSSNEIFEWCREKIQQYLEEDAPEWIKKLYEQVKATIEKFLKEYCHRSSLCYKIKNSYERHGMKQVRRIVRATFDEKMMNMKKSGEKHYEKVFDFIVNSAKMMYEWTEEFVTVAKYNIVPAIKKTALYRHISSACENFKKFLDEYSNRYFNQVLQYLNGVLDNAMENELVQEWARSVKQFKIYVLKTLKQTNIKEDLWESFKTNVVEKYPKTWIREKIQVHEFDPDHGRVKLQFSYPFDQSRMQLLKNALVAAKNKMTNRK